MIVKGQRVALRTDESRTGTIVRTVALPGKGEWGYVRWDNGEDPTAINPHRESALIILGI